MSERSPDVDRDRRVHARCPGRRPSARAAASARLDLVQRREVRDEPQPEGRVDPAAVRCETIVRSRRRAPSATTRSRSRRTLGSGAASSTRAQQAAEHDARGAVRRRPRSTPAAPVARERQLAARAGCRRGRRRRSAAPPRSPLRSDHTWVGARSATTASDRSGCSPLGHSFSAPALVFMIRFWKTKNITATGIVMMGAAASLSGNWCPG